jgi:peptidoglycan DL-endopeptidase CwlO
MGIALRVGRGGIVAVVALVLPIAPGAAAGHAVTGSREAAVPSLSRVQLPSPTASPTTTLSPTPMTSLSPTPTPTPTPTPSPSVPSEEEVAKAKEAAAAAAKEVADITAEVKKAEARLQALQREVAESVAAEEQAEQRLTDAEGAVRQATEGLSAARRSLAGARRALSGHAAVMYMQGGDLQNLTTLLLSAPGAMSDLSIVLDQNAREVRHGLDTASSAAVEAAVQKRRLTLARDKRAIALKEAGTKRADAEEDAKQASAEAAELGKRQEALTARLDELEKGAEDLVALREAAAREASTKLLGLQAAGPTGSAPRTAQEVAHSMMPAHGWDDAEFVCLVDLWNAESGWSWSALNPSSGAYGIPQSLPGWKMASAGSDWLTNPATQIAWGMGYIKSTYGSPCQAHASFLSRSPHWY